MISLKHCQQLWMKALGAEAHAVDAVIGQRRDLVGIQCVGIGLDSELFTGGNIEPVTEPVEQPLELPSREIRGSAAADKNRLDRSPRHQMGGHFGIESIEIFVGAVVVSRDTREVAVAAFVSTKGYVHISRLRRLQVCSSSLQVRFCGNQKWTSR